MRHELSITRGMDRTRSMLHSSIIEESSDDSSGSCVVFLTSVGGKKVNFFVRCVLNFIFLVTQARTNGLEGGKHA